MNQLKFWRLERGLSQVELKEASGVPRWNIQLIEGGIRCPSQDEIAALALALGVETEKLFTPSTIPNTDLKTNRASSMKANSYEKGEGK